MDTHPIPQDVTGFQFKLIGDMTVKQFAYLAGGGIIGWLFFSLPLFLLIKIPMSIFFALLGVALAFLPVAGRPLDFMLASFLKALFSPTQYIYQKTGANLLLPKIKPNFKLKTKQGEKNVGRGRQKEKREKQTVFLQALPKAPKNKLDEKEEGFFSSLFGHKEASLSEREPLEARKTSPNLISALPVNAKRMSSSPQNENPLHETEVLAKKAMLIEKELETAKKEEVLQKQSLSNATPPLHQNILELEKQLVEVLRQKEKLTQDLLSLQQKLETQKQNFFSPTIAPVKKETKNVRSIPKPLGKTVGLPITPDAPNLLTGIVKNPRGQPLPNILIEVKDAEGNAVRAFKTNGIGHFASATPLINGLYTIIFEDPSLQNKFDAIQFEAKGEIILPLEIVSLDQREELRKSLFGGSQL